MKFYGYQEIRPQLYRIKRPDVADMSELGAPSKYGRLRASNRRATRRRHHKAARRRGKEHCRDRGW